MKKENRLLGSLFARFVAYTLLTVSVITGIVSALGTFLFCEEGIYRYQSAEKVTQTLARALMVDYAWDEMVNFKHMYVYGNAKDIEDYCEGSNFAVEMYEDGVLCWENYDGTETPYSFTYISADWEAVEDATQTQDTDDMSAGAEEVAVEDGRDDGIEEEAVEEVVEINVIEKQPGEEEQANEEYDAEYYDGEYTGEESNGEEYNGEEYNGEEYNGEEYSGEEYSGEEYNGEEYNGEEYDGEEYYDEEYDGEEYNAGEYYDEENYAGMYYDGEYYEEEYYAGEDYEEEIPSGMVWKEYTCRLYVNPDFPYDDEYSTAYNNAVILAELKYICPVVLIGSLLIFLMSFIFLMCSAGHKKGREGITPSVLSPIHFDVLTLVFGVIALGGLALSVECIAYGGSEILYGAAGVIMGAVVMVWCTIYCMEFALRLKLGAWWKHTLIYIIFHAICRGIRFLFRGAATLIKGIPLIWNTVIIFMGICILEFMGLCIWCRSGELIVVWFLEKLILFPLVLYISLVCKKLQEGSEALAEGNLSYKVDTSKMLLVFKEHGENLNQIGQGISKAVNERMKSEHMKTELITNVSHDLKTPLTSIINYADLLGNAAGEEGAMSREKLMEYSEVLLRQSRRLKKLLEDLVEASKATTGNLEVNLEKCEISVLLSQAVGEYEPRLCEKQLELMTRQPENPVWIMADGRRLWRVFDNLLNNICKYAQENSRVYLTVEQKDEQVEIIFRNMSKYPLELTGEELEERFVRGDKSRHMEGNGLGLSIAKSLVELQNGTLEIVTDGDLFKVTLRFKIIS